MTLPTESVTFRIHSHDEFDTLGNPVAKYSDITVSGCIVAPKATDDRSGQYSLTDSSAIVIHTPSTFVDSLKNAIAVVRGREWKVVGDPIAYTSSPLQWNREVVAEVIL